MKKRHKMKNPGLIATLAVLSMMIGLFMTVPVRAAAVDNLSNAEKNSSYGFFIWLSETLPEDNDKEDALIAAKLLKNEVDDRYNSIVFNQGNIYSSSGSNLTYQDLLGQTDIGAANDATSLSFLEEAISYADLGNAYRAKESLAPLKISSALMAMAELDANYQGYNGFWGHPLVFNCLENLAAVYASYWPIDNNPYSEWYDKEKTNYDTNNGDITGHYETLTDRNGKMLTTGFAIRVRHDSEKHSQYYSQQFSNNYMYNIGNGFTPAQYKVLLKEYHCVVLGHQMKKTEAEPPTCEEDGRIAYYTCENCGKKFADEEGKTEVTDLTDPAAGHQWKEDYTVDKEATCTEEGTESIHCSVCDEIQENSEKVIPKKEHTKGDPVRENEKDATCQTEGSYEEVVYCKMCNTELSRETKPIAKTEHEYGDWITTKEATCTEPGKREKECAKCKDKVTEEILAAGHKWKKDYTVDKEATCTEEGTESIHCSVCDEIQENSKKAIPKKEHAKGEPVRENEKGATCQTEGSYEEVVYCKVCNTELSRETKPIAKTEHEYGDWITTKEAACTESGQREKECAKCGDKVTGEIPATGHNYTEVVTKNATCTENGVKSYTCKTCNHSYTESIPMKEHTLVTDNAVAPTYDRTGLTEGSHCSVCGKVIKKQEVVPVLQKKNDPVNVNNPSSVAALEKKVTQNRNDGDIKGSTFKLLQLRAKKVNKNSITLAWTKVKNADGYIIYGNMCNTGSRRYQFKVLKTLKGTSWKHVKLKKGTYYKYTAVAYKMENGFQKVLASSKTVHAATAGGKVGNYRYVKVNKKSVKLKKGKTFAIKPKQIPSSNKLKVKKHRAVCYESSNTNIADVSKRGVIKAKKRGSCVVYVYSQSGVFTKVKVTVK